MIYQQFDVYGIHKRAKETDGKILAIHEGRNDSKGEQRFLLVSWECCAFDSGW